MKNEIQHLRIGLKHFASDGSLQGRDLFNLNWVTHQLESTTAVFAYVQCDSFVPKWVCQEMDLVRYDVPDSFKLGPVYEAQIGERLLNGSRVTATEYLGFYSLLPARQLESLIGIELRVRTLASKDEFEKMLEKIALLGMDLSDVRTNRINDDTWLLELKLNKALNFYFVATHFPTKWCPKLLSNSRYTGYELKPVTTVGENLVLF